MPHHDSECTRHGPCTSIYRCGRTSINWHGCRLSLRTAVTLRRLFAGEMGLTTMGEPFVLTALPSSSTPKTGLPGLAATRSKLHLGCHALWWQVPPARRSCTWWLRQGCRDVQAPTLSWLACDCQGVLCRSFLQQLLFLHPTPTAQDWHCKPTPMFVVAYAWFWMACYCLRLPTTDYACLALCAQGLPHTASWQDLKVCCVNIVLFLCVVGVRGSRPHGGCAHNFGVQHTPTSHVCWAC